MFDSGRLVFYSQAFFPGNVGIQFSSFVGYSAPLSLIVILLGLCVIKAIPTHSLVYLGWMWNLLSVRPVILFSTLARNNELSKLWQLNYLDILTWNQLLYLLRHLWSSLNLLLCVYMSMHTCYPKFKVFYAAQKEEYIVKLYLENLNFNGILLHLYIQTFTCTHFDILNIRY